MKESTVGIVACASLREQIEECLASLEGSFRVYPIVPSCTFSVKIDLLRHYLDRSTAENDVTLLAYGICHPQLLPLLAEYGDRVVRIEGSNCHEMFLGSEKYAEYHRKCYWMLNKPFFTKWKNEILTGFGAGASNAGTLIGDTFKKLVYVRFEKDELSMDLVEDFARTVGLEYEIHSVDTANLKQLLEEALASAYSTARVKAPKSLLSYPQESEMRTMLESISEAIYKVDIHTKQFTFVSPQVERTLGYIPAEFLDIMNDNLGTSFYYEDDRQRVVAGRYKFLVNCLNEGMQEPYEAEYRAKHKNGDVLWVKESIYPSYSAEGIIESFVGKIADITERKRAEEVLRASQQKYKELAESITDVFFAMNNELRYTYWNRASEELTGISAKDALGKHLYDIFPDAEMTRKAERMYLKVLKTKEPQHFVNKYQLGGKDFFFEISAYPTKDGLSVFVKDITERKRAEEALQKAQDELEMRVVERTAELARTTGELRVEITERKQAEEELRKSEENFRALAENAKDGIAIVAGNGELLYTNRSAAEITGHSRGDLSKTNMHSHIHLDELKKVTERLKRRLSGKGAPRQYETLFVRKDGSSVPVELATAKTTWLGEPAVLAIFRDISEQKRLRENMQFYVTEVTRAQEVERKRVARELHDETAQSLAILSLEIEAISRGKEQLPEETMRRLNQLRAKTDSILEGVRRFSQELRPEVLDQLGLMPALELLTKGLNEEGGINAYVEAIGCERRLSTEAELMLFRITQEALRNVGKHSQATEAVVRVEFTPKKVKVSITDNGKGFELPEALGDFASVGKMGLIGMHERARLLNASFSLKSKADKRTTVAVEVTG